ncbi:hypothetical protein Cgig2_010006 [Carnegiea gigantea]|uniref:Uncharacterized protein n=1 Tax=Carnegiea gigantea TaxID=171969 RepID=A0A9Q1Q8J2_9CARY|nr:hypothetical protein Cgig2_010006 [Carnegiea gigantea]
MQVFIQRIWVAYEIYMVIQVCKGVFLVRFGNLQWKKELYTTLMLNPFWSNARILKWICTLNPPSPSHYGRNLDVMYWGLESLSKIRSIIGTRIKTDRYAKAKIMIKYARLLIEVALEGPFLDCIELFNENEVLIKQQVKYEWSPTKCSHCHMFGHEKASYKKKGGAMKEWRKVQSDAHEDEANV